MLESNYSNKEDEEKSKKHKYLLSSHDIRGLESPADYSTDNSIRHSEGVPKKLWRHKGKIASGIAAVFDTAFTKKYLDDLRDVASNHFVNQGLNNGEVVTSPVRPEIFHINPLNWAARWAYLVDTGGQTQMNPTYEVNKSVSCLLDIARKPITYDASLIAAALTPFAAYAGYRACKYAWPTAEKNVEKLSKEVLPDFAHEKISGAYKSIKKKLGK